MFQLISYPPHDDAVAAVERARARVTLAAVADAFVASLGSGVLALREVLGRYVIARHLPRHACAPSTTSSAMEDRCGVCGYCDGAVLAAEDLPRLATSLERFADLPPAVPTPADADQLRAIVAAIERAGPGATRTAVDRAVAGVLKAAGQRTNTYQRRDLLETLAWCNVLAPRDRPGFLHGYVPFDQRRERNEWGYPLGYWTGADGVNHAALREVFPVVFTQAAVR
jgi:hypothetical protein